MMTEFTIALFFLMIISLSQGEMRDQLEHEMEVKTEFIFANAGSCSELHCESMFDLDMETGLVISTEHSKYLSFTFPAYECFLEVRTYRTTSKSNWDPMVCTGEECKCSGMDCTDPQPQVLIKLNEFDENWNKQEPSEEELKLCNGILADNIQISREEAGPFKIYELVFVNQEIATWKDGYERPEIIDNGEDGHEDDTDNGEDGHDDDTDNDEDGHEEDTDNGEDGHEGNYSFAVCHSINVVLSVTGLLIAIVI